LECAWRTARTIAEVATRQKKSVLQPYRAGTDNFKYAQRLRRAMADLFEKTPGESTKQPRGAAAPAGRRHKVYNIVHLIYRARNYEGHSKDYEFSRASMQDHWARRL